MLKAKIYNQNGKDIGEYELNESVFAAEYNEPLIHQVVVAQMANARQGTKSALTRTEVRGGGKKPWRQKGTGRARQGSIRSPQWRTGGVVFAPKPRDFSKKVNKQAHAAAIRSALSALVRDDRLIIVDEIKLENAKTKEMAAVLDALKVNRSALMLMTETALGAIRASANIPFVKTLPANQVNVYDLVACNKTVVTLEAVKKIEQAYKAE